MPLSYAGSDDNALAALIAERGISVALTPGSTLNAVLQAAAAAGVTLTGQGSDRKLIEELYEATAVNPYAYPLDDDGTLAGDFGYAFAGPAVGANAQSMDYTAESDGSAILAPHNVLSTARFSRPQSGYVAVEAVVTATETTCGGILVAVITDAGGNIVNVASINADNGALDKLAVAIAADGTVTGFQNETALDSPEWIYPGAESVGPTDKVGFALGANTFTVTGDRVAMTLRTHAADITGDYGAGVTDPWGNPIGGA